MESFVDAANNDQPAQSTVEEKTEQETPKATSLFSGWTAPKLPSASFTQLLAQATSAATAAASTIQQSASVAATTLQQSATVAAETFSTSAKEAATTFSSTAKEAATTLSSTAKDAATTLSSTAKEAATTISTSAQQLRRQSDATVLAATASTFSRRILSATSHLLQDLESSQSQFVAEKRERGELPVTESEDMQWLKDAVPPWVGQPHSELCREKMMALSLDRRNVLVPPPVESMFQFDMKVYLGSALATLEADPVLKQLRFELVPKLINEETFWRHYFYRVSLVKQEVLMDVRPDQIHADIHAPSVLFESKEEAKEEMNPSPTATSTDLDLERELAEVEKVDDTEALTRQLEEELAQDLDL